MIQNKKLVYILPEASEKTHMKYNVEFITALAKEKNIDTFLILERGNSDLKKIREMTGAKFVHYTGTSIFRILKLEIFLIKALLLGYRKVYVHYSFIGAISASLNPFFTTYYWNCGMPWNYKRPFFQELYESFAYKVIDHFVTGANILINKYSDYYKFNKYKSIIIPNWIDVEKSLTIAKNANRENLKKELNLTDSDNILFFNQRLADRKGAHYILPVLKATENNVKLIITNDGPYKETLIQELKDNNLQDRVRLLGRVPNEKVINILSVTDIYILPSEEEGMSHSLMEAMATGTAAVSFDVGGTIDMYPENFKDFVVKDLDILKFIDKVNLLLQDGENKRSLGEALFEKVKEYDKNIILDKFVKEIIN